MWLSGIELVIVAFYDWHISFISGCIIRMVCVPPPLQARLRQITTPPKDTRQ